MKMLGRNSLDSTRRLRCLGVLLGVAGLLLARPAEAASIFTIDGNGNGTNQTNGKDEIRFGFTGSLGVASGSIRPIDLGASSPSDLQALIASYVDFSGGSILLDFENMDVLVFDVVLDAGSAPLDALGVAVGNDPVTDPAGAGFLSGGGETPDLISLLPGIADLFPGAAHFSYAENTLSAGNLEAGEISARLFATWSDSGLQTGQTAAFSLSSGTNAGFQSLLTDSSGKKGGSGGGSKGGGKGKGKSGSALSTGSAAVPEPGTALLMSAGLAALALRRRVRSTPRRRQISASESSSAGSG